MDLLLRPAMTAEQSGLLETGDIHKFWGSRPSSHAHMGALAGIASLHAAFMSDPQTGVRLLSIHSGPGLDFLEVETVESEIDVVRTV